MFNVWKNLWLDLCKVESLEMEEGRKDNAVLVGLTMQSGIQHFLEVNAKSAPGQFQSLLLEIERAKEKERGDA